MTDLTAHGIDGHARPSGWEGRVFRRPLGGRGARRRTPTSEPAAPTETTNAVLHVSTIALPPGVGDFASGAVDKLGHDDVFVVLFEYDPSSVDTALFKSSGIRAADRRRLQPQRHAARHPRPGRRAEVLQRPGSCVLPVRGASVRSLAGNELVPRVNEVLASLAHRAARGPDHDIEHHDHDRRRRARCRPPRHPRPRRRPRPRRAAKDRERPRRSVRDHGASSSPSAVRRKPCDRDDTAPRSTRSA